MTTNSHSSASAVSEPPAHQPSPHEPSFAETAMKLGGKSEEEARRMGAVDKADDQVEGLFAARFQTVNSPVHRASLGEDDSDGTICQPASGHSPGC